MEAVELDTLTIRNSNTSLIKKKEENGDLTSCARNLTDLNDNMKHLIDLMIKQNSLTEDLIILTNKLLRNLENKNTVSGYRDWISYFISAVQGKLDANVWSKVQFATSRKVRKSMANYADSEKESILELVELLKSVNMSLYDYEMLTLMRLKSNEEFHGDKTETQEQAEAKLQASFPEEMMIFKEPLEKLFNALSIWDA